MRKKSIAMVIAVTMAVGVLAGCGSAKGELQESTVSEVNNMSKEIGELENTVSEERLPDEPE